MANPGILVDQDGNITVDALGNVLIGDEGAACCCDAPAPCRCQSFNLYDRCGAGPGTRCCVVPPDYDLKVDGQHLFSETASGRVDGPNFPVMVAPPSGLVRRETISYHLVGRARCVDGQPTFDTAGSWYRREERHWVQTPSSGSPRYVTATPIDASGDDAWAEYYRRAGGGPQDQIVGNYLRLGIINHPRYLALTYLTVSAGTTHVNGNLCAGTTDELIIGHIDPTGTCLRPQPHAGGYQWTAQSRCNSGFVRGSGTAYQLIESSGFCTGQVERRGEASDSVEWTRNDLAVPTADCREECPPPPERGACCFTTVLPGGFGTPQNCRLMSEADCRDALGIYKGDRTDCQTAGCEALIACCLDNGTCLYTMPALCTLVHRGNVRGSICGPGICSPTGACCLPGGCAELTEAGCLAQGGLYRGDGTTCSTVQPPCGDPPNNGSCCLPDGTCMDTDAATCAQKGGRFITNTPCSGRTCVAVVPSAPGGITLLPDPTALPLGGCGSCGDGIGF